MMWMLVALIVLGVDLAVALWQMFVPGDIKIRSWFWYFLVGWQLLGLFALAVDLFS